MNTHVSIRELNANVSATLARVEAGERLTITKNGRPIAELSPPRPAWMDDPEKRARVEEGLAILKRGLPGLQGPATYEERTE